MELELVMADPAGNRTALVLTPVPAQLRGLTVSGPVALEPPAYPLLAQKAHVFMMCGAASAGYKQRGPAAPFCYWLSLWRV